MSGNWSRRLLWVAVACGLCLSCPPLGALSKLIRARPLIVPDAPVFLKQLKITLVEVYGTPTQVPIPGTHIQQSRVRYANRAGIWPSSYLLQGEVWCHNHSKKQVEALALTVILLDAFNQTIEASVERGGHHVQRVVQSLPSGSSIRASWEQPISSSHLDIFEVAILVTAVRFEDGEVWAAPHDHVAKVLFGRL